jgi:type IV pilus biogenesis protein PilP
MMSGRSIAFGKPWRTFAVAAFAAAWPLSPMAQSIGDLIDLVDPAPPAQPVEGNAAPGAQEPVGAADPQAGVPPAMEPEVATEAPAAGASDLPPGPGATAAQADSGVSATVPGSAAPTQITPDPITDEAIRLLQDDGLIARQQAINEGLLLMDRQLRQAQLVQQVLAVVGPGVPIEVSPGEFVDYSETPAGLRQQIDFMGLQIQLAQRQADLAAAQTEADIRIAQEQLRRSQELGRQSADTGAESPGGAAGLPGEADLRDLETQLADRQAALARIDAQLLAADRTLQALADRQADLSDADASPPEQVEATAPLQPLSGERFTALDIIEISGANGRYVARLAAPGEEIVVRPGDDLPNGQRVVNITMRSLILEDSTGESEVISLSE